MAGIAAPPPVHCRALPVFQIAVTHDRAPGGIAVLQRQRTAQHLDAIQRAEREARRLPLPVDRRRRNAVDHQLDAADAEGGTRAEPAALHLQVLRVVLPVQHGDTRHPHQRLGQAHLALAVAQHVAVDHADRAGKRRQRPASPEHLDTIQHAGSFVRWHRWHGLG